jgi:hypothetical protein
MLLLAFATLPRPVYGAQDGVGGFGSNKAPFAPGPVSLTLSGWGWHVARDEVGNVTLTLDGALVPRDNTTNVIDIYLEGTLLFNLPDRTDNFTVELRGTKVNSVFFLKEATGGSEPLVAEFEGVWFDVEEPAYVACEGRLAIPEPGHVANGYVFILRSYNLESLVMPQRSLLGRLTVIADGVADSIVSMGTEFQNELGETLEQIARLIMQLS